MSLYLYRQNARGTAAGISVTLSGGDDLDVVHPVRTTYGTDGDEI